jgi:hypothetical protein
MKTIPKAWLYSEVCCHQPNGAEEEFRGASFYRLNSKEDSGYIAFFDDEIIIGFSGTKNILAWASNFDPFPLGNGMIHDGFYKAWSIFKSDVDRIFRNHFKISGDDFSSIQHKILCTGHSRGGAIATLCARHLAKNRGLKVSNVSFGNPAQGNKAYREQFAHLPIFSTRVVNGVDMEGFELMKKILKRVTI